MVNVKGKELCSQYNLLWSSFISLRFGSFKCRKQSQNTFNNNDNNKKKTTTATTENKPKNETHQCRGDLKWHILLEEKNTVKRKEIAQKYLLTRVILENNNKKKRFDILGLDIFKIKMTFEFLFQTFKKIIKGIGSGHTHHSCSSGDGASPAKPSLSPSLMACHQYGSDLLTIWMISPQVKDKPACWHGIKSSPRGS